MATEQELLNAVLNARQKVVEIDALLSEAKEVKKKAEMALIEYMDDKDIKSFRSIPLNCTAIQRRTLYVSVVEGKKDEAMRWIEEDCGRPDMLKKTIHHKTLTSFISKRLKDAEPIQQGLFDYYFKPELTIVPIGKEN